MRRNSVRLGAGHQLWLYAATLLLYASGAIWGWLHYLQPGSNDFGSRSPIEPWMMKLHGAGAIVLLLALGTLIPGHIRFAWHARRNRVNGVTLIAVLAFLIMSGYGLYYFGDERLRTWTSWSHLAIGLALPAMILLHIWSGRRSAVRKAARRVAAP